MNTSNHHDCKQAAGCGCHACRQRASEMSGELPHWRMRRQQRLGSFIPVKSQNSEWEGETATGHQYFRQRKVARHQPRYAPAAGMQTGSNAELFEFEFSSTPNPVRSFHGITPGQVLRKKPRDWRKVPALRGSGWVLFDDKGMERIRFMRPNPRYRKGFKQPVKWDHIKTGYWVVRDAQGNYLDGFGNIIAPNIPVARMTEDQKFKLHIPYSGVDREWEFSQF